MQRLESEIIAMLAALEPHPIVIQLINDLSAEEKAQFKLSHSEDTELVYYGHCPGLPFKWFTVQFVDAVKEAIEYRTHILVKEEEEGF